MKIKFAEINTVSNYISLLRVLLFFPIYYFLEIMHQGYEYRIILVSLFLFGFITDILDGFLARKLNQVSEAGKIIDPFADKLLIGMIVIKLYLLGEVPGIFFWTIILRDVLIFLAGIYVSKKIGKVLPSNLLGKITVFLIGNFLIAIVLNVKVIPWLFDTLLYLCIFMSFMSLLGYGLRAYENIKWKQNETI
ncbi:MAG: CDP-alcohol phosphatidyltransferase family protein [Melioribacteraceae bacterium]|nr:CDP-alcohol phosphatidyltransferase family protein [Melioribacteraceae bacterium]MCF8352900.1 CDP-alcohol phosphatidyltransferase family protein [Melioribacteraceae bacterium]MCF8393783.1 CDP-alcohol phosphatidyltransferase family protein [Melioribacteraceae bacterium]MCF8417417.1 CDP-alcohol phosphatidyltransferase family protein [Melioribacteraceae bacterium]